MKFWLSVSLIALQLSGTALAGPDQAPCGNPGTPGTPGTQTTTARSKQPNIVFIMTDDQDLHLESLDYMPSVKKHMTDQGTFYKRHFCTTALCCPSRVSLWTGKQAHNTNVTDVSPPFGGYPKFVEYGFNEAYLPVWLQEAGYNTYYTGKLFNAHSVDNYNKPHPGGWTGSDFLLDPYTYSYLNSTYQRNQDAPVSYEGQHSSDVFAVKSLGFLDDAAKGDKPFFIAMSPIAPHSNAELKQDEKVTNHLLAAHFSAPIPAKRHEHLFPNVTVPRTGHFNPDSPSGASWVRQLSKQSQENIDYNDHFYRQRLRALQTVDELVDDVFKKLEEYNLLENTYVFYTSDNGFHIGQHRLQPGKACGYEEDINVPLIVRGPGVQAGKVADIVTTHIDMAPTLLELVGAPIRADFDGEPIPLNSRSLDDAAKVRHEHVTVEFWGYGIHEGKFYDGENWISANNTYKSLRIISKTYNFYYSVWCNNEHELYDMTTDPQQLHNLLHADEVKPETLLGVPFSKVVARLDSLLFVLKSCKGQTCVRPWQALHPEGNVENIHDALASRFDDFYENQQKKVSFDRCVAGQVLDAEGPQFEHDGLVYRHGARWDDWA
ncbi:alkaline-phosphatase-like protein [Coniochaeta sp. 2T2.1]|nr:alkaline-phosphatase-like protein [Coniochaeta sp. 2T2.1]